MTNRELKFRQWYYRKDTEKWLCSKSTLKGIVEDDGYGEEYEDYIWEQYTGLKDKNGREIYEGDIVRIPSSKSAVVNYDAGAFTIECTHCSATWTMDRWCSELGLHLTDNICTEVEVIGNIHEDGTAIL